MPAEMAASRGWMSEVENENNFRYSAGISANPPRYSDETNGVGDRATLALVCEPVRCRVGGPAMARACLYESRLGWRGKSSLSLIFFPVPSIARKIIFSLWQTGNVFTS